MSGLPVSIAISVKPRTSRTSLAHWAKAPSPAMAEAAEDVAHMRSALALARRGVGNTWPNPSVGCVVVNGGRVVGRAVTAPGGRPHAEPAALDMAGASARDATVYVTLEP